MEALVGAEPSRVGIWLGLRVLRKPDDPPSLKATARQVHLRQGFRRRQASAVALRALADKLADRTAGQATRERAAEKMSSCVAGIRFVIVKSH